jgi:hypothetical protein
MHDKVTSYPLEWPLEVPRAKWRTSSKFRHEGGLVTLQEGIRRVKHEIEMFGATEIKISMDLEMRTDSDAASIKKAYRQLTMQHHPDRGGNASEFHRVTSAYNQAKEKGLVA